jgi:hypothetical protein
MKLQTSATTLWSLTSRQNPFDNKYKYEDGDSIQKFIKAVQLAHSLTPDSNRGMRDSIALAALEHLHHLMTLKDFQALVQDVPAFGSDMQDYF